MYEYVCYGLLPLSCNRMDRKSKKSEDSYPNLVFYVDNYEQVCSNEILIQLIFVLDR